MYGVMNATSYFTLGVQTRDAVFLVRARFDKAQTLFELGLENCPDNPFLLQAFAVMEEGRGNQAKVSIQDAPQMITHPPHPPSTPTAR